MPTDDSEETTPSESFDALNLHSAGIRESYSKQQNWTPQGRIVFLGRLLFDGIPLAEILEYRLDVETQVS